MERARENVGIFFGRCLNNGFIRGFIGGDGESRGGGG